MRMKDKPIIGQEAICPDGLGRVIAYVDDFPTQWIQVETYAQDRSCKWAPHNVELIDPRGYREVIPEVFILTGISDYVTDGFLGIYLHKMPGPGDRIAMMNSDRAEEAGYYACRVLRLNKDGSYTEVLPHENHFSPM